METRPAPLIRRTTCIAFIASISAMLPSFIWIWRDGRVWPYDQAWYGEVSAELYATLIFHPGQWLDAMRRAMGAKPPLLSWLGQIFIPFGLAIHKIDFALLLLPVLAQFATLLIVWQAARMLTEGRVIAALFALLLTASAPLFVGLSHQYLVESLQTTIVAASFLLALRASTLPAFRSLLLLVLLVFAGFAVKSTTPLYCGLAWLLTAVALVQQWIAGGRARKIGLYDFVLLLVVGVLVAATSSWYATNISLVIEHARLSTQDDAGLYGKRAPFFAKLAFWLTATNSAFFILPGILLAILAVVFAAYAYFWWGVFSRQSKEASPERKTGIPALVSGAALCHVLVVIIVLSSQPNEESRFLEPCLPLLALAATWSFDRLPGRALFVVLCVLLVIQLGAVHLRAADKIGAVSANPWLMPVMPETDERTLADSLIAATCPKTLAYRYIVIGVERPSMNANSMSYHAAKAEISTDYRCYYTSLGYAETNAQHALDRIDALRATFVVLPDPATLTKRPDAFNIVDRAVEDAIIQSARYSWSGHEIGGYRVYRRAD